MPPFEYWIIVLVTAITVTLCVALHYEGLRILGKSSPSGSQHRHRHRHRIIFVILCILLLHILEIWIFGLVYYSLLTDGGYGGFAGMTDVSLFDCVYFSATVFTTLGFGDIVPVGGIRFLTGTESVVGLTFITWSASYTFVELMKGHEAGDG